MFLDLIRSNLHSSKLTDFYPNFEQGQGITVCVDTKYIWIDQFVNDLILNQ